MPTLEERIEALEARISVVGDEALAAGSVGYNMSSGGLVQPGANYIAEDDGNNVPGTPLIWRRQADNSVVAQIIGGATTPIGTYNQLLLEGRAGGSNANSFARALATNPGMRACVQAVQNNGDGTVNCYTLPAGAWATLLDANGNTQFPGQVTGAGGFFGSDPSHGYGAGVRGLGSNMHFFNWSGGNLYIRTDATDMGPLYPPANTGFAQRGTTYWANSGTNSNGSVANGGGVWNWSSQTIGFRGMFGAADWVSFHCVSTCYTSQATSVAAHRVDMGSGTWPYYPSRLFHNQVSVHATIAGINWFSLGATSYATAFGMSCIGGPGSITVDSNDNWYFEFMELPTG